MRALLIIDMLEDFFEDGPLRDVREDLCANINKLVVWARGKNVPVIWVRQEFRPDLEDAFLVMKRRNIEMTIAGTHGARILSELARQDDDYEIIKKRYSAFYGTALDELLAELGTTELILAGVNTHACIRTAAIDAYQRDLDVTIPIGCVSSKDLEHHDVTLRYLEQDMARLVPLEELVQG